MTETQTAWLSEGLEVLLEEVVCKTNSDSEPHFDVLIIGSGYGGAIAAARLAGTRDSNGNDLRIAVLERGKEYLPGMFPSGLSTLTGHTRVSGPLKNKVVGNRDGLFDIRVGGDISALVANGLGGGSLINAGVMEQPRPQVFDHRWPEKLHGGKALEAWYTSVREQLGAARGGHPNTIAQHAEVKNKPLDKLVSLQKLGGDGAACRPAAISVAMRDGPNNSGVAMRACELCGDCATGCNFGAKDSLDVNLLVEARRRGVRLFTGATVLHLWGRDNDWTIEVLHTDPKLAQRAGGAARIRAAHVILAAGTFGSAEILARSRQHGLRVSDQLGHRFSGNGDMLAVGFGQNHEVNAVVNEETAYAARHIGPTITGIIDLPASDDCGDDTAHRPHMVIEEMAVPGAMRRIFEEIYTTAAALQNTVITDCARHAPGNPAADPLAVDPDAIRKSSIYAVMGDDGAAGRLELRGDFDADSDFKSDGAITVKWPQLGDHALFPAQIKALKTLAKDGKLNGQVIGNPLWRPLPDSLNTLFDAPQGPLLTVHPLGGCAMGNDTRVGVVDDLGRVFTGSRSAPKEVYETLAVMDGSIIPSALEINPALTIAVVAARAIEGLIKNWKLQGAVAEPSDGFKTRPIYRRIDPAAPGEPIKPTTMEFAERLCGPVFLATGRGGSQPYQAEITLYFQPKALRELYAHKDDSTGSSHTLHVATHTTPADKVSRLRLFAQSDWDDVCARGLSGRLKEEELERLSVFTAPLAGSLTIMGRERSHHLQRVLRAGWAWLCNRGIRDTWQKVFSLDHEKSARKKACIASLIALSLRQFSHAGEVRLFQYQLTIGDPVRNTLGLALSTQNTIAGVKRITYRRRGNPLEQLSTMTLTAFPHLVLRGKPKELALVPEFLARNGLPLFRIAQEHDGPQAIADLLSLSLYFARLLIGTHLFSLRQPDLAQSRVVNRLPGNLRGLPAAERTEVPILHDAADRSGIMGHILLTRYRGKTAGSPPVMLIHGYSASGTTFAHPALEVDLARYLWHRNRDVWILDMRSSCGAKTATVNYTFEQLAATDIPVAVDHICQATACQAIDIVAHCMGAAMFSMAVLDPCSGAAGWHYQRERKLLPARVRRAVLSQVGPLVSMAPANIFRAYLFSFLKHWLPLEHYSFSAPPGGSLLDRALATIPYPKEEFDLENPLIPWRRTPWTTARHRMDLLYGRTFSLANMSRTALAHIDDFFGPLSVETATQVAHFAKYQSITNDGGVNHYVSRARLRRHWRFPTLSLHGRDNGLADVATVHRMQTILADAGCDFRQQVFDGFGHQDCFIGRNATPIFAAIDSFLDGPPRVDAEAHSAGDGAMLVQVPWSGPVIGPQQGSGSHTTLPVSFGCNPGLSPPTVLVAIPLQAGLKLIIDPATGLPLCRVHPAPAFVDGWAKMLLPLPHNTLLPPVHSMLLLLAYDETPELDNALFGVDEPFIDAAALQQINWTAALTGAEAMLAPDGHAAGRVGALAVAVAHTLAAASREITAGIVNVPHAGDNDHLHFVLASCQYPPGILDHKPGLNAYDRLAAHISDSKDLLPVDLMLLVGDQVYVDATAGLADPSANDERYVHPYHNFYRARQVREVLRQVPAYMMLDDHEIADNWEPLPYPAPEHEETLALGRKHYLNFQRGLHLPATGTSLWYSFVHNGFHFFVADTRTERQSRDAGNVHRRSILGEQQTAALEAWLDCVAAAADPTRPKFIVSPAMFAPRQRRALVGKTDASAIHSDGWEGYPASLTRLLQQVAARSVQNLVLLSGDAHLSCIARIVLGRGKHRLSMCSVHASPLFAPYPFANAEAEEFMAKEAFVYNIHSGRKEYCHVNTTFAGAGSGFAVLKVEKTKSTWQVSIQFNRK